MTLAAARYSSEDAAQVVEYIQAVVDFSRKSKPYLHALQTLKKLKSEMEKIENREVERSLTKQDEITDEVNAAFYSIVIPSKMLFIV